MLTSSSSKNTYFYQQYEKRGGGLKRHTEGGHLKMHIIKSELLYNVSCSSFNMLRGQIFLISIPRGEFKYIRGPKMRDKTIRHISKINTLAAMLGRP